MIGRLAALIAVAASVTTLDPVAAAPRQRYSPASSAIAPVVMAASCRPEAAAEVDIGAAWLVVREPDLARPAFDRAVDHDPDCALGYWGQVLAQFPLAAANVPTAVAAAEAAIGRALAVPAPTPFERAAVAALRALRDRVAAPGVPAAWPPRVAAYREALCAGAASDRRIRLWCARALADAALSAAAPHAVPDALPHIVELARERPLDVAEAVIVLDVAADPRAPIVERALATIAQSNPPASWPHARAADMAVRRGDWTAAASFSARAGAASRDPSARARAFDVELEALMQLGRRREAYARAGGAMRQPADAVPDDGAAARAFARMVIADRRIDGRGLGERAALPLDERAAGHWPAVFVAGLDAALRAWPGPDAALVERARRATAQLETLAGANSVDEVNWAATIIKAAIAASQDEHQEMALFLTHAAELERSPVLVRWSTVPLVPTAEIAAELWLRTYRYDDARRDARAVLEAQPQRISPYVVLARTASRVLDANAASEAWRRVLTLRATADADDTIRLEAQRALDAAR